MSVWQERLNNLSIETRAFINGQYVAAADGKTFASINPATEEEIAQITECGDIEVNLAVKHAKAAFEAGVWADLAPRARATIMQKLAALMTEHAEELALLETIDTGKPISDCRAVDIGGSIHTVQWYAEVVDKIGDEIAPLDPKYLGLVTRQAVGVVAAVVPWNFPLMMASWKYAPALAAGNSVILKPSEKSPLTAIRLAQLAKEAGIPDGVFQVLPGPGSVGKALSLHMDVDCVAFTGSTNVGKLIMGYGAQSNLKRVWLELGGKSPNIVFPDCPDLKKAARAAAGGIYYNMGQVCTAGSRVLVHEDIKDEFIQHFKEAAKRYVTADPLNDKTTMGPLVDSIQYEKVLDFVARGKAQSTLIMGGEAQKINGKGYFLEPTAFETQADDLLATEEIFGPVLSIITFKTQEEAVAIANNTHYGLAAALWTSDLSTAHKVARKLRAGTVWVNCYDEGGDMNLPFGGFKQSGNGRDKSIHALEKYTELKSTMIKL